MSRFSQEMLNSISFQGEEKGSSNSSSDSRAAMMQFFGAPKTGAPGPWDGRTSDYNTLEQLFAKRGAPAVESIIVAVVLQAMMSKVIFEIMKPTATTALKIVWTQIVQEKSLFARSSEGAPPPIVGTSQRSGSTTLRLFSLGAMFPVMGLHLPAGQQIAALQIDTISKAWISTLEQVALMALLSSNATVAQLLDLRGRLNPFDVDVATRKTLFFLQESYGLPQYIKRISSVVNHGTYGGRPIDRVLLPVGVQGMLPYMTPTGSIANQGGESAARRAYAGYGSNGEGELPVLPSGMKIGEIATERFGNTRLNQLYGQTCVSGYVGFPSGVSRIEITDFQNGVIQVVKLTKEMLMKTGRWDRDGFLNRLHGVVANHPDKAENKTRLRVSSGRDVDPFVVRDEGKLVVVDSLGTLGDSFSEEDLQTWTATVLAMMNKKLSDSEIQDIENGLSDIKYIRGLDSRGDGGVFLAPRNQFGGPADVTNLGLDSSNTNTLIGFGNPSGYLSLGTYNESQVSDGIRERSRKFKNATTKWFNMLRKCFPRNPFLSGDYSPSNYRPGPGLDRTGQLAGYISFLSLLDRFDNGNSGSRGFSTNSSFPSNSGRFDDPNLSIGKVVFKSLKDLYRIAGTTTGTFLGADLSDEGVVTDVENRLDFLLGVDGNADPSGFIPVSVLNKLGSLSLSALGDLDGNVLVDIVDGVSTARGRSGASADELAKRAFLLFGTLGLSKVSGSGMSFTGPVEPAETVISAVMEGDVDESFRAMYANILERQSSILSTSSSGSGASGHSRSSSSTNGSGGIPYSSPEQAGLGGLMDTALARSSPFARRGAVEITGKMKVRAVLADDYDFYERIIAYLFITQPSHIDTFVAWIRYKFTLPIELILWQLTTTFNTGTVVLTRSGIGNAYYGHMNAMWGKNVIQKSLRLNVTTYFGAAVTRGTKDGTESSVIINKGAINRSYASGGGISVADVSKGFGVGDLENYDLVPVLAGWGSMFKMESHGGVSSFTGRGPYTLGGMAGGNEQPNTTPVVPLYSGAVVSVLLTGSEPLNRTSVGRGSGKGFSPLCGRRSFIINKDEKRLVISGTDGLGDGMLVPQTLSGFLCGLPVSQPNNHNCLGSIGSI